MWCTRSRRTWYTSLMDSSRALLLLAVVSLTPTHMPAQSVSEKDGSIFFADASGRVTQLTTSGLDFAPSLSPDGKLVVFVRHTPGQTVTVGWGETEARELWVIGVDAMNARLLARGAKKVPWTDTLAQLDRPQFLSDSRRVVFGSALAVVHGTVNLVDIDTGQIRRIGGGNFSEVVREGRYRDNLIVIQHRYFLQGGSYDWYWVVDLDGKEVGPIGPDEKQVEWFKQVHRSDSQEPTDPRGHASRTP